MDLREIFSEHRVGIIFGLLGLFFLGIGVLSVLFLSRDLHQPEVEILSVTSEEKVDSGEIVVDVAGAVAQPGIYRLSGDVRLNDFLNAAGGFTAFADTEWVERYLNLAQKAIDGSKLYIPEIGEGVEKVGTSEVLGGIAGDQYIDTSVNINTASLEQLEQLKGIGEKRAQAIISSRPYQNPRELVERNIIPESVFEEISNQLVIY